MKQKLTSLFLVITFLIKCNMCNAQSLQNKFLINSGDEAKIKNLLSAMSLSEKVGQMTQIGLAAFADGKGGMKKDKLRDAIIKYHIGSILNGYDTTAYFINQWHDIIELVQNVAVKETKLKIPIQYGVDATHGASFTRESTIFPHQINIGFTRNETLAKNMGEVTAMQVRASGIRWAFAPQVDVAKNPLWPRLEEVYGEDTYLNTRLGVAVTKGLQGTSLKNSTSVAACIKSFIGYSVPLNGMDRTPAYIPENFMRDYYLPPFKAAIDAGAASIMVNTSSVNGVPLHASKYWLTDVLKKELGFKGIVVTDWFDIVFLQIYHKTAVTYREAVKQAINAGNDLNMAPFNYEEFCTTLISLVMKGEVKMERINDAVTRILRVKFATGLFDNAFTEKQAVKNFNSTTYKQFALQAAHESIILLKNGDSASKTVGLLPLSKKEKYLVIGPTANSKKVLHGSWSYAWQGNVEELYPATTLTLAQALQEKIGKENIICNSSSNFFDAFNYDASFIEHHKNEVDKIILCLGEQAYAEFIGNIPDLTLPDDQLALAEAAIKTGKPVILILLEGRPRIIRKIEPHIESIVLGMRPGSEGGSAIADVLFGDYNPDGKLSITYPKYPNDLSNYDVPWTMARYQQVQYPFGHGLSYTNFMVGNIELSDTILKANQTLQIFIPVTNSGKQSGKIAIDLFVSDVAASEIPAGKRLKRFTKIELQPGETKKIQFNLTAKDVSFVNTELQTVTEPGDFEIMVADKKAIFHFKQ